MKEYIGIDIGGTKCAVIRGNEEGKIMEKQRFPTQNREKTLEKIFSCVRELWTEATVSIGVSCGGPLDQEKGMILSPPNLPGWDKVPITRMLQEAFGAPVWLENDADACAVAEWQFGAGKGCSNMIFLTFGTGLGAGLILNGRLYPGSCGMAGEVGHIRLFPQGHIGYGKAGSYEGYCSGGGIAQYGLGSAEELAQRAKAGDSTALAVWRDTGRHLGSLLAILVDLLNPEKIVIGSIYARAGELMEEEMQKVLREEALGKSLATCKILPAKLGEALGDIAALSVAMHIG